MNTKINGSSKIETDTYRRVVYCEDTTLNYFENELQRHFYKRKKNEVEFLPNTVPQNKIRWMKYLNTKNKTV